MGLRVDAEYVFYRFLGANGVDDDGLRDDCDFVIELEGLRERAGRGGDE